MTKPKFRCCPACQVENQAIRKFCIACYASLSKSKKIEALKDRLDNEWGQGVWKNRNAARVVSSAQVAVQKLAALGYMPILFIGRKKKNSWIADISAGMALSEDTRPFVDAMKKAYEYLLKKQGPQMSQPQPQPDQHIQPHISTTEPQPPESPVHHQPQIQLQVQPQPQQSQPRTARPNPNKRNKEPQPPESLVHHQPQIQLQVPTQPQPQPQQIQPQTAKPNPNKRKKEPQPPESPVHHQPQIQLQVPTQPQPQQSQSQTAKPNPNKRKKGCRKCIRQKVWQWDSIIDKRMTEDKAEVKVRWMPCSQCCKQRNKTMKRKTFAIAVQMPSVPSLDPTRFSRTVCQ
ncbi:uncharacterized protein [Chanodichthys erythropterus]|uniref:uncharacterized protein n=1 Tax=Chanodichthys erythropterus TaxID=933992 RepID=UPI00351DD895